MSTQAIDATKFIQIKSLTPIQNLPNNHRKNDSKMKYKIAPYTKNRNNSYTYATMAMAPQKEKHNMQPYLPQKLSIPFLNFGQMNLSSKLKLATTQRWKISEMEAILDRCGKLWQIDLEIGTFALALYSKILLSNSMTIMYKYAYCKFVKAILQNVYQYYQSVEVLYSRLKMKQRLEIGIQD